MRSYKCIFGRHDWGEWVAGSYPHEQRGCKRESCTESEYRKNKITHPLKPECVDSGNHRWSQWKYTEYSFGPCTQKRECEGCGKHDHRVHHVGKEYSMCSVVFCDRCNNIVDTVNNKWTSVDYTPYASCIRNYIPGNHEWEEISGQLQCKNCPIAADIPTERSGDHSDVVGELCEHGRRICDRCDHYNDISGYAPYEEWMPYG